LQTDVRIVYDSNALYMGVTCHDSEPDKWIAASAAKTRKVSGWDAPIGTGKGVAFGLTLDYPNDFWSGSFIYREVQDNYNPAVGFTLRTGYRRLYPTLQIAPRPRQHPSIRRLVFGANANLQVADCQPPGHRRFADDRGGQSLRTGWTIRSSTASRRSIAGLRRSFFILSGSETGAKHNRPARRIPVRLVFPEVYA
jgi:hypothetical protein